MLSQRRNPPASKMPTPFEHKVLRTTKQHKEDIEAAVRMQDEQTVEAPPPNVALLLEAITITSKDRNSVYGNPEDNFANIAGYWSHYLSTQRGMIIVITPQDVAHLMILMKIARLSTNPDHRDSLLDVAGYAACGERCRDVASEF